MNPQPDYELAAIAHRATVKHWGCNNNAVEAACVEAAAAATEKYKLEIDRLRKLITKAAHLIADCEVNDAACLIEEEAAKWE